MGFLDNLADYYDKEADKFHRTRQRHRPEFDILTTLIKKHFPRKKNIRVLELGCGSGRLLSHLQKQFPNKNLIYTGVDISRGLINIAKKDHPDARWKVQNMTDFLSETEQESYDLIIGIASFHHLPSMSLRVITAQYIYSALDYDGLCFLTNRSDSKRFRSKFKKSIVAARRKSIISFGIYRPNDLFLPRKSDKDNKVFHRYYHIFSLSELSKIAKVSGFGEITQFYLTNDGSETLDKTQSRNSCSIWEKKVFVE